ncbi:MAG: hypothetical protein EOP48_28565 [Sphingobacteriales bacterium]|nr:MAG: hypothetical protein EOP48_28565 [Sphingobacteriales bacterium]
MNTDKQNSDLTSVMLYNSLTKRFSAASLSDAEIESETNILDAQNEEMYELFLQKGDELAKYLNEHQPKVSGGYNALGLPCWVFQSENDELKALNCLS